jgi:hypothetical protein
MSAEKWMTADLREMLALAAGRVSPRKLDLFNLWCCRALRPYLTDARSRAAVRFAEDQIDRGWPDTAEAEEVRAGAKRALDDASRWARSANRPAELRNRRVYVNAALVAQQTVAHDKPNRGALPNAQFTAYALAWANGDRTSDGDNLRDGRFRMLETIFRDLVGNPFQPIPFNARWRTVDVLGLARAIDEDGAFDHLPILADALMDAGCWDDEIIGHCRGRGPHARGCWLIDLVLQRC